MPEIPTDGGIIRTMAHIHMFQLGWNDLAKGAVTAFIVAIITVLYGVINAPGFDLFAVEWSQVFQASLNAAIVALFGYLGKNLLSDKDGKFLGVIG